MMKDRQNNIMELADELGELILETEKQPKKEGETRQSPKLTPTHVFLLLLAAPIAFTWLTVFYWAMMGDTYLIALGLVAAVAAGLWTVFYAPAKVKLQTMSLILLFAILMPTLIGLINMTYFAGQIERKDYTFIDKIKLMQLKAVYDVTGINPASAREADTLEEIEEKRGRLEQIVEDHEPINLTDAMAEISEKGLNIKHNIKNRSAEGFICSNHCGLMPKGRLRRLCRLNQEIICDLI